MALIFTKDKSGKIAFAGKKKVYNQSGFAYSHLGYFVNIIFILGLNFGVIIC